jgi:plastocyanin
MTVTKPDWRFVVHQGDRVSVTGYYDNTHPWYEAMAIMFAWAHPLTPEEMAGRTPCTMPATTTGDVTGPPDPPNPVPVFGGDGEGRSSAQQSQVGAATTSVAIRGFDYSPGGLGQPPAAVHRGDRVTFTNYDAAGSIFHSVTSCVTPCDGDYGQSYPLATWPASTQLGDSGQLGYGPPFATASVQRASWTYSVPADTPDNTLLAYFCRIHPFMRGSLKVVQ